MTVAFAPIVIAGPTASGKSALAVALATSLRDGGEIVCADSRQLYQGMRVVSAAPSAEDHARAPHHLYESVPPEGTAMTAGAWAARADELVAEVQGRGRVPILVGGTGLYLRAWRIGLEEPSDPAVRARIDAEAGADLAAAYARLRAVDPAAADTIEPTDRMRVVRALEIFEVAGRPRGAANPLAKPPRAPAAHATWLLVDAPLDALEPRIRARAQIMFGTAARDADAAIGADTASDTASNTASNTAIDAAGAARAMTMGPLTVAPMTVSPVVAEATALAARLPPGHRLLDTLGVREALDVAAGRASVDDAVARTTLRTRQYARRQRTWFKKEPWWQRLDASASLLEQALRHLVR